MDLRPWLAVLVVATAVHTMGCGLIGGCGVGPAPGPDNQNGTVTFDAAVGASQELPVPFQDSADVTDTITSASLTGPDAAAFLETIFGTVREFAMFPSDAIFDGAPQPESRRARTWRSTPTVSPRASPRTRKLPRFPPRSSKCSGRFRPN